jgi:DNA-directed RNA polymerase subunit RPC12/RpoP
MKNYNRAQKACQYLVTEKVYLIHQIMLEGLSMVCPKCSSDKLHPVSEKHESGGFDNKTACMGAICLGPVGLLCGNKKKEVEHKTFWVCSSCGNKFEQEKDEPQNQEPKKPEGLFDKWKKW